MSARVASSSSGGTAGGAESLDDVAAQRFLRDSLDRLQKAPFDFLGVGADPTAGQARAAFLSLTKTFHPTKFARFSPDTVRLANEVFLALKRVCENVGRPAVAPAPVRTTAPRAAQISPGGRREPVISPSATSASSSGPIPQTSPQTSVRLRRQDAPALGSSDRVPAAPPTSGPIPSAGSPATDLRPSRTTPIRGVPTGTSVRMNASAPMEPAPPTPASTARMPRLDVGDNERGHFEQALELLRRRLWSDAERMFTQLSVAVPTDKRYRAYRDYARGRIAQDLGRHDEARTEWQRALALDPTLMAAKLALEQLPEPEPTKPTGFLGKLFRR